MPTGKYRQYEFVKGLSSSMQWAAVILNRFILYCMLQWTVLECRIGTWLCCFKIYIRPRSSFTLLWSPSRPHLPQDFLNSVDGSSGIVQSLVCRMYMTFRPRAIAKWSRWSATKESSSSPIHMFLGKARYAWTFQLVCLVALPGRQTCILP